MAYLGLGKTLYNSSACWLEGSAGSGPFDAEIALTERISRKKGSGAWPDRALKTLSARFENKDFAIAENRDVITPLEREEALDKAIPFFSYLQREKLERFSRQFNPELAFLTHHRCHASAATMMSPFEKSILIVIDGAGSAFESFPRFLEDETKSTLLKERLGGAIPSKGVHEECSVYLMDHGRLRPAAKRWRKFQQSQIVPGKTFSEGVGIFYESAAEYVFNSNRSAGKVMGLAPFGRERSLASRIDFLESLNWKNAFKGKGNKAWDECGRFQDYADVAASVQAEFEAELWSLVEFVREAYPDYENLIITGGCALNCTFNAKLVSRRLFSDVYVPPFPGDESIGFGAASHLYLSGSEEWRPFEKEKQHGFFGPSSSVLDEKELARVFSSFELHRPASISELVAERLARGEIVAWFQGRSESGPRSLGHRSILANPAREGLKNELNARIKFREDFRPYGSSCLHEKAHEYFEVSEGFDNPYMSFAVRTRADWRERLSQVTHVDGTSRMQTVRSSQNPLFHELIAKFGAKTGLFCVLNTSLNVMGEPIVETAEDARNFLEKTPVQGLAIGPFFIERSAR